MQGVGEKDLPQWPVPPGKEKARGGEHKLQTTSGQDHAPLMKTRNGSPLTPDANTSTKPSNSPWEPKSRVERCAVPVAELAAAGMFDPRIVGT